MAAHQWDAHLYDTRHAFVAAYGSDLITDLAPRPGERVLDAGCGTGDLTDALRRTGARVVGVDASPQMIERARHRFPDLDLRVADLRRLDLDGTGFDAVFSNATLHWIPDAQAAATALAAALRPGGRLAAEFGGAGNVTAIDTAARALRAEQNLPAAAQPWYFPDIAEYSAVLDAAGLTVTGAWLFDRPTRLEGEDGLTAWVRMFAPHLVEGAPDPDAFLAHLADRLRPRLHHSGSWWADYRRLRVLAAKPAP
ncbi:class I SAM-dependent methyltransferase [Streptomonospora nanhaiensis]|uniref:Trans-aconitate methyltransferase n=1 Tax=Streptomonospora nanhaiensis TaxID=1323731 RepID=A0A853BHB7_9ACTN|nr:class I SAM-dependent methyltransferase [Streptomonospora nanhaiensis]MBV2366292.1 methyltransferase domain-containing protein [Streptomonospora nanhaiensis]NYI94420.1 trans-aconitate methyltransferase [Streptomonospora nanhaiensis]